MSTLTLYNFAQQQISGVNTIIIIMNNKYDRKFCFCLRQINNYLYIYNVILVKIIFVSVRPRITLYAITILYVYIYIIQYTTRAVKCHRRFSFIIN